MGTYEVKRVVAKRVQGGKAEYFIKWKDYDAAENSWEPEEHLADELVTSFESRSVDPDHAEECKERLGLLFERALKCPMACNETLTMRHNVVRSLFPGMPSDLRGSPYLASENDLIAAGLASSLKKHLTVTGAGWSHYASSHKAVPWQVTGLPRRTWQQKTPAPSGEGAS